MYYNNLLLLYFASFIFQYSNLTVYTTFRFALFSVSTTSHVVTAFTTQNLFSTRFRNPRACLK